MDNEEILNNGNVEVEPSAGEIETSAVETTEPPVATAESGPESSVEVGTGVDTNGSVEAKPKYTELEKAQYSFHKQFARQNAKHKQEMDALREEFNKRLTEELDKRDHPEKYRPKTRSDFEYDDDYVNYLTKKQVDDAFEAKIAEYKKQAEEKAEQERITNEYRELINRNIQASYTTPEAIEDWKNVVGACMDKGLGTLIDTVPDVANYLTISPNGPKLLYAMASDQNKLKDIFVLGQDPEGNYVFRSPQAMLGKIERLEQELLTAPVQTAPVAPVTPKVIGKPGLAKEPKKSLFEDNKALLDWMYK